MALAWNLVRGTVSEPLLGLDETAKKWEHFVGRERYPIWKGRERGSERETLKTSHASWTKNAIFVAKHCSLLDAYATRFSLANTSLQREIQELHQKQTKSRRKISRLECLITRGKSERECKQGQEVNEGRCLMNTWCKTVHLTSSRARWLLNKHIGQV